MWPITVNSELTPLIPVGGSLEIIIMYFILWPLGSIFGVLFGYILTPIVLYIHKKSNKRSKIYGIHEGNKSQNYIRTLQSLFPALLALNLSIILAENSLIAEIVTSFPGGDPLNGQYQKLIASLTLSMFFIGIAMAAFTPAWFLSDAGIEYLNIKTRDRNEIKQSIKAEPVGKWYLYFIKGYSGISGFFSYITLYMIFIFTSVPLSWLGDPLAMFLVVSHFLLFLPIMFLLALAAIPAIVILEAIKNHRIRYTRKWANKFGINNWDK